MAGGNSDHTGARLQGATRESERRPELRQWGLRAVAVAAGRVAAPVIARRGGGILARLKGHWSAAVGEEFAAVAWPEGLGRDGALKLRVTPAAALELQHRAPLVIERINRFFGHAAVARLVLVQGRLPLAAPPRPGLPAPLTAAEEKSLEARLADIADAELRGALAGLGSLVLGGSRRPG